METIFRYPISLENKGWIILGIILFFPIGLLLILKNMRIHIENSAYMLNYRGSFGWLVFWSIFFFPLALLLILLNGVDVCKVDLLRRAEDLPRA